MAALLLKVREGSNNMFSNMKAKMFSSDGKRDVDFQAMFIMIVGLSLVAGQLELGQLAFALVGAVCYAALQASRKMTRSRLRPVCKAKGKFDDSQWKERQRKARVSTRSQPDVVITSRAKVDANFDPVGKQDYRQESSKPVSAPFFIAHEFEAQVHELLGRIVPSSEGDLLVQDIADAAKKALSNLIPEAEVLGFASGDVLRGTAFAVAIPEVDIILNASPNVIVERLLTVCQCPCHTQVNLTHGNCRNLCCAHAPMNSQRLLDLSFAVRHSRGWSPR
jgi:hypothetical protein